MYSYPTLLFPPPSNLLNILIFDGAENKPLPIEPFCPSSASAYKPPPSPVKNTDFEKGTHIPSTFYDADYIDRVLNVNSASSEHLFQSQSQSQSDIVLDGRSTYASNSYIGAEIGLNQGNNVALNIVPKIGLNIAEYRPFNPGQMEKNKLASTGLESSMITNIEEKRRGSIVLSNTSIWTDREAEFSREVSPGNPIGHDFYPSGINNIFSDNPVRERAASGATPGFLGGQISSAVDTDCSAGSIPRNSLLRYSVVMSPLVCLILMDIASACEYHSSLYAYPSTLLNDVTNPKYSPSPHHPTFPCPIPPLTPYPLFCL